MKRIKPTGLKLHVKVKTGKTLRGRKVANQIGKLIRNGAFKALGPGFAELVAKAESGRMYASEIRSAYHNLPNTDPTYLKKLSSAYSQSWQALHGQWLSKYAQSGGHEKFKERNQGRYPYNRGPERISHTSTGFLTGYFKGSVTSAFVELADTEHMSFTNVALLGGFRFKPESYPHRVSPYRGYANKKGATAHKSEMTYVQSYLHFLLAKGIITDLDTPIDFSNGDWARIAMVMRKQIQERILDVFPELFREFEIKV